jgi:AraC-like DNA-binding protein
MELGGTLRGRQQTVEVRLLMAHIGVKQFAVTRWKRCRHRWWVLDLINQGWQEQRIGRGKNFTRLSGVAALYAPGCDYCEQQIAGGSIEESYIIFDATGAAGACLRQLMGARGWCHFRDPDHLISAALRRAAELLFYRRPGFDLLAHSALLELLGLLVTASPPIVHLRDVRADGEGRKRDVLVDAVERFICDHITDPMHVADLAAQVKMSPSAFAHAYSRRAGESPYRTLQRLKIEQAKRFLLRDGLSVKECAARLGFSSEFHFSRLFKGLEGVSPSRYRHALMEKTPAGRLPPRKITGP